MSNATTNRLREAARVLREPRTSPLARALADWLDEAADHLALHLPVWGHGAVAYPEAWKGRTVESNVHHHYGRALAVADEILGAGSTWEKADLTPHIKEHDKSVKDLAELYEKVNRAHVKPVAVAPGDLKEGDWVTYRILGRYGDTFTDRLVEGAFPRTLCSAGSGHIVRNRLDDFASDVHDVRLLGRDG